MLNPINIMLKKIILSLSFFVAVCTCNAQETPFLAETHQPESTDSECLSLTDEIQVFARQLLGTRYRYGGKATHGFDCSGLVNYVFGYFGIQVAHASRDLYRLGNKMSIEEAKPGDLIFFRTSSRRKGVSHVGIVLEPDEHGLRFIHSATSKGVIISYLKEKYYNLRFVGIRRVIDNGKVGNS